MQSGTFPCKNQKYTFENLQKTLSFHCRHRGDATWEARLLPESPPKGPAAVCARQLPQVQSRQAQINKIWNLKCLCFNNVPAAAIRGMRELVPGLSDVQPGD